MFFNEKEQQREKFEDLLFRLKCDIEFYNPKKKDSSDWTLEELKEFYEIARHVASTLDIREIRLIWNLRCSGFGSIGSYLRASQKRLEAYEAEKHLIT